MGVSGAKPAVKVGAVPKGKKTPIPNTEFSPYESLPAKGFFAYSGADGDLYRSNKLGGWRVSIYPHGWYRIQKKGEKWRGTQYWITVREYGKKYQDRPRNYKIPKEETIRFDNDIDKLLKEKDLQEKYICPSCGNKYYVRPPRCGKCGDKQVTLIRQPKFKEGQLLTGEGFGWAEPHYKVIKNYPKTKSVLVEDLKTGEQFEDTYNFFAIWNN